MNLKKHMEMLDNGNYEEVISPIQHECISQCGRFRCLQYSWNIDKLILDVEEGDPYESDGYQTSIEVKYCPFCGYCI